MNSFEFSSIRVWPHSEPVKMMRNSAVGRMNARLHETWKRRTGWKDSGDFAKFQVTPSSPPESGYRSCPQCPHCVQVRPGKPRTQMFTALSPVSPRKIINQRVDARRKPKMGRRLHMSRSAQNRNKPSRARLLESVSPMDNRGCFHAASVLTTFLIGSFWAELRPSTLRRSPHRI